MVVGWARVITAVGARHPDWGRPRWFHHLLGSYVPCSVEVGTEVVSMLVMCQSCMGVGGPPCVSQVMVARHGLGTVPAVRGGVGDVPEEVLLAKHVSTGV